MATAELPPTTALDVPRIGPECAGILMSPEEFDAVDDHDEDYRYELVRGVLVVTPVPLEEEADPNERFGGLLFLYQELHPQGRTLDRTRPERYVRTREGRRRPDRVIWAGLGRRPDEASDIPSIAVEFVSGGKRNWSRDYVLKRNEYLEAGVAEYWIFDRFDRILTVYRNSPTGAITIVVEEGETYRTPLLPGFDLPISRLLEVVDY